MFLKKARPVLYNLVDDQAETTNVAAKHPEVVQRMVALAKEKRAELGEYLKRCLLYTSPSPRDATLSRMPSSA